MNIATSTRPGTGHKK